jgi:exodeoxyribonuclease VII small subunit
MAATPKKKSSTKEESPDEPAFDERLARLEELVAELEGGELTLEDSLSRYGEGVKLLRSARNQLEGYRQKVEELGADSASKDA